MTAAAEEQVVTADELYKVVGEDTVVDVESLLVKALQEDMKALNELWQIVYAKAAGGDPDAGSLALRLLQWRNDLAERQSTLPAVKQTAKEGVGQTVRRAAMTLGYGSVHAANALVHIARYGRSETAKLAASKAILDRVGIAGAQRLEVAFNSDVPDDTETGPDPLTILKERLGRMQEAKLSM